MAWTQADADQVRAAVVALAAGKRVASVTYAGPPERSITYGQADLAALRALLSEMDRSAGGAPTFRRFAFSKGFDTRCRRG